MKKIIYILVIFSFARQFLGQTNLVPNPSFENYSTCPSNFSDLLNWDNYGGSPDPYNTCSTFTWSSVPANWYGYQNPFDGNGYTSLITYCKPCSPTREYMGAQLTQTLNIGTKYFASVYISKTDSNEYNWINCPTNRFGFRFSTIPFSYSTTSLPDNYSQVNSTVTITNSLGWTKISGSFVADSNYRYVALGNFFDNLNMDTSACNYPYAFGYYYLDQVCVSTDSMFCNVATNINSLSSKDNKFFYPNPTSGHLNVDFKSIATIKIIDKFGQYLMTKENFNEKELDLSNFKDGIYFIEILYDNRTLFNKIVVQH